MGEPQLVAWLLVVLSAAACASCLARAENRGEALVGSGMAVMSLPASVLDPRPWVAPALAAVFVPAALWALLPGAGAAGHRVHRTVCAAAMAYMAVATARSSPGHAHGMVRGGAGGDLATGLFVLYFTGYALRAGMGLAFPVAGHAGGGRPSGGVATARPVVPHVATVAPPRLRHAPELAVACRVSMALGMVVMLLVM